MAACFLDPVCTYALSAIRIRRPSCSNARPFPECSNDWLPRARWNTHTHMPVGRPCWSQIIRFHHRFTEHFRFFFFTRHKKQCNFSLGLQFLQCLKKYVFWKCNFFASKTVQFLHWSCNFYTTWKTVFCSVKNAMICLFLAASWSSVYFTLHCKTKQCKTESDVLLTGRGSKGKAKRISSELQIRSDDKHSIGVKRVFGTPAVR